MTRKIQASAHLAHAEFSSDGGYPPWQPQWEAQLLKTSLSVFKELFSREAKVEVIHAGLECGIISDRCPGMEMISFGPTIRNAHSPDEMLYLPDVEKIWLLLVGLLGKFT